MSRPFCKQCLQKDLVFINWQLMLALASLERLGEKDLVFINWRSSRLCLQNEWSLSIWITTHSWNVIFGVFHPDIILYQVEKKALLFSTSLFLLLLFILDANRKWDRVREIFFVELVVVGLGVTRLYFTLELVQLKKKQNFGFFTLFYILSEQIL